MIKTPLILLLGLSLTSCASNFYYEKNQKVNVTKLSEKRAKSDVIYYKTDAGHKVGVQNEIIVQCNENVNCKEVLNNYDIQSISNLSDTLLLVTISKEENVFEFSQKLYNDKDIQLSHPNFIKEKKRR